MVSVINVTTSSVTDKVLSNKRLSRFSIDHAISLMLTAPTIRPEPFKVWKPRRSSVNGVKSCASSCHIGKKSSRSPITSSTSSMNISRMSSSISKVSGFSCWRIFNKASLAPVSIDCLLSNSKPVKVSVSKDGSVTGAISPLSS